MNRLASALPLTIILAMLVAACAPSAPPQLTATPVPPTPTSAPLPELAPSPTPEPTPPPPLEISSPAFEPGGEIPVQYSCHGANLSPPLQWPALPEGTQSLALLVRDADSQPPGFVHWVIYNIPGTATGLVEGVPAEATLPDGTLQGINDFANFAGGTFPGGAPINQIGYDGPCPPAAHRYVFTLYALDKVLDLESEATETQVLDAMEGHVLDQAELTGVYTPPG